MTVNIYGMRSLVLQHIHDEITMAKANQEGILWQSSACAYLFDGTNHYLKGIPLRSPINMLSNSSAERCIVLWLV